MKLSLFLCLLMVAVCAAGKDWAAIKKWQKVKVLEWCFGEENIKQMMVKWKKAYAECSGMDAPELDLPMFNSPYRLIKGLLEGAETTENMNMAQLINHMQHTKPQPEPTTEKFIQLLLQQQQQQQQQQMPGQGSVNNMLKKMVMKQMVQKMLMGNSYSGMGSNNNALLSLFSSSGNFRTKRQADGNLLELGERLSEKLEKQQMEWTAKAGNCTCMLKKMKYIKNDERLDLEGIMADVESYNFPDPWLKKQKQDLVQRCYAGAEALPREVLSECIWGDNYAKIYHFMKCCNLGKYKMCMNYDTKKKLEENFGTLQSLAEQTGVPEKQLLPMVQELLQGEMDYFFE